MEKTLFNSGERKGREKGKTKEKYAIAFKMKQQGIDLQVIVQCTGFTVEKLKLYN